MRHVPIISGTPEVYSIISQTGRGSSIVSVSDWQQAAPSSIPTSGTFFRGDLVMKQLLRPFSQLSVTGERMCIKYW